MITPDKADEAEKENEAEITPEERTLLNTAGEDAEEHGLHQAELDDRDNEGELLNEVSSATDKTGRDLDVPGSEDDDDMEDIGSEDEENNNYSQADTE
jgi:hypothetical protein